MSQSTDKRVKVKKIPSISILRTDKKGKKPRFPRDIGIDINVLEEKITAGADDLLLLRDDTEKTRKKIKYSNL